MANVTLVSGVLEAKSVLTGILARSSYAKLNAQYPNDFEYYLCALELVDATDENNVLEYFAFPIMPSNISIQNTKLKSITKTSGGIVTLENNTFVPLEMQISGNFGRKMKTISGNPNNPASGTLPFSLSSINTKSILNKIGVTKSNTPQFSLNSKTGYGCTKLLERIFDKSTNVVNGAPVKLFFYNFAFNAHYLVEPMSFNVTQSEQMNMIWEYNMNFKLIAPANEIVSDNKYKQSLSKFVKQDNRQKGVSAVMGFVKNQKSILSNQLLQKVGDGLNIDENLNKIPQLPKAIFLP